MDGLCHGDIPMGERLITHTQRNTAFKIRLHASWSIGKNDSFEKQSITHILV
jgi:hypothetical protein